MATTEVILREKVEALGAEADVVKVKAGFARNFLIPQGKAYEATEKNLKQIEGLKAARAQREAEELQEAQRLAGKIAKLKPTFTLDIGQGGKAFGSVTSMDLHDHLVGKGIEISRSAIQLDKPIKTTGRTDVEVKLSGDIVTHLVVTVKASEESEENAGQ